MDISALSKSRQRTKRATKLLLLTQPLSRFTNDNATDGWNIGRQHAARFEALAAIRACHEMEVMR